MKILNSIFLIVLINSHECGRVKVETSFSVETPHSLTNKDQTRSDSKRFARKIDVKSENWRLEPLKCTFYHNEYDNRYECLSVFNFKSLSPNVKVSPIDGLFTDGKAYNDVDTIVFKQAEVLYIPDLTAANLKFPNFVQLFIHFSGLKHIERAKLANMPQLKVLNLHGNEIEHFDEDVFDDLVNLEVLAFVKNKIKFLPQKLIWNLINLKEFWSFENPIEEIPSRFFNNNKKLVKAWMGSSKISKIDVDFKELPDLEVLDLRGNECIDLIACSYCALSIEGIQEKIDEHCYLDLMDIRLSH